MGQSDGLDEGVRKFMNLKQACRLSPKARVNLRKQQAELVAASDEKMRVMAEERQIRVANYLVNITSERMQELEDMPYQEFLRTFEWKQMSWLVQQIQKVCFHCGGKPTEVNHRYYFRGRFYPEALEAICRNCYEESHGVRFKHEN